MIDLINAIRPIQWLLIGIANAYGNGLDKKSFEDRLQWAMYILDSINLEQSMYATAADPMMFAKLCNEYRQVRAGKPTASPIGLDASASGMQIMSALTRCQQGCRTTNLIYIGQPLDSYTYATTQYNAFNNSSVQFERDAIKNVTMTHYYGSRAEPRKLFTTNDQLRAFYQAMQSIAPGANSLLKVLVSAWDDSTTLHEWALPDGYHARVPVLSQVKEEILNVDIGVPITMIAKKMEPLEFSVSLAANVVHSLDAYLLRCMVTNLNYDPDAMQRVLQLLYSEYSRRCHARELIEVAKAKPSCKTIRLYTEYRMPDLGHIGGVTKATVMDMSNAQIKQLIATIERVLSHPPFEMFTVHDAFYCHPNHAGRMADEYRNILADLSDSQTLPAVLKQLGVTYNVPRQTIGNDIRKSQYALA